MNIYQILLVLASFELSISTNCAEIVNPTKKKDCNGYVSEDDKAAGIKYCCYLEVDNNKGCMGITQEAYDSIGKSKKEAKDSDNKSSSKGKIECQSLYLKSALIYILLFLFL